MLSAVLTRSASADVFSYELVGITGRNNVVDSNASSCDSVEGCYTRTGARCSDFPNLLCDLQIVPAGRCTYGNLGAGLTSCVWPHQAGHCSGNSKVGCLTADQCADAGGTCLLTTDIFGALYAPTACTCQGTNAVGADFETVICGGTLPVCSDGDPMRDVGGLGNAIGLESKLGGAGSQIFADLGPSVTGSGQPTSTPVYALENPPGVFDAQRDAGTMGRGPAQGTGPIHQIRTTEAREVLPYFHPTIATPVDVRKVVSYGDSYWSDWTYRPITSTLTFNIHTVMFNCDVPLGWIVGSLMSGGLYCHQYARDGFSFLWGSDLTPAQVAAYTSGGQRVCPPNCNKDFNLTTTELQELSETTLQDPFAADQLALQSGEEAPGRQAGSHDAIGVTRATFVQFYVDGDLRCRMGGWGNAPGLVGRCVDGPRACAPGTAGDSACAVPPRQDGLFSGPPLVGGCRACSGVYNSVTNPLGLPIGYNTHGRPELDLVAGQRIGGVSGQNADVVIPLFIIETTGNTTAQFRDIAAQGLPDVDLADMGPVDPDSAFASGIGAGGTFTNGVALNIDHSCCVGGVNVPWDAAQLGTVQPGFAGGFSYRYGPGGGDIHISDWALVYDKGPGPDGIPGCIGDNTTLSGGVDACNQRLGGAGGPKTDGFFATGKDDRAILRSVGSATIPASGPRFRWGNSPASIVTYFGTVQNPPIVNTVAALGIRDVSLFLPRSTDVLAKLNTTACPLTNAGPQCTISSDPCAALGGDTDLDGVCDSVDNCPTVANADQADGGVGPVEVELPPDGVGNACDNCVNVNNPIVPGGAVAFLAANPWAVLTGGQRDDDHDGYGNICDGDFNGSFSTTAADTAHFKASVGDPKYQDSCGTGDNLLCAMFDLNSANSTESSAGGINSADTARYKVLVGKAPGPRCPLCTGTGSIPLPCTAGAWRTCF